MGERRYGLDGHAVLGRLHRAPHVQLSNFAGQPCWIGLDLASKTDIAALVMVFQHPEIPDAYADLWQVLPARGHGPTAAGNSQYERLGPYRTPRL